MKEDYFSELISSQSTGLIMRWNWLSVSRLFSYNTDSQWAPLVKKHLEHLPPYL